MASLEKISYEVGLLVGGLILMTLLPTSGFATYKAAKRFSNFAKVHSISRLGADVISQNLYDCLPYCD